MKHVPLISFILAIVLTPLFFRTWTLLATFGVRLHHPVPTFESVDQVIASNVDGVDVPIGAGGMIRVHLDDGDDPDNFLYETVMAERWHCSMCLPSVRLGTGFVHLALPVNDPVLDVKLTWVRPHPDDEWGVGRVLPESGVFLGSESPWSMLVTRPSLLSFSIYEFFELGRTRNVSFSVDDSVQVVMGSLSSDYGSGSIRVANLRHVHHLINLTMYVERYDERPATQDDVRAVLARIVIGLPEEEFER